VTGTPRRPGRLALLAVIPALAAVLGATSVSAGASYTDAVTPRATISTRTVPAPTGLGCPVIGLGSAYVYWTAVPGATRYDIYEGSTLIGSTTGTAFGAGLLLENRTYTVVTNIDGWQSPFTSSVKVTLILVLVSCVATA